MFTMHPRCWRIITRPAAWLAKNVPSRFTARVKSKSSTRTSSAAFAGPRPTLLTRMSRRPKCATVSSTARETSSSRVMSICKGNARRPVASISFVSLPPVVTSRKPSATSAPAWARANEIARPRPRAAPVTNATSPVRSNRGKSFAMAKLVGTYRPALTFSIYLYISVLVYLSPQANRI